VGVASVGSTKVLKGYWRRNFTEKELEFIKYDEAQGTYIKPKGFVETPIGDVPVY